MVGEPTSFRMNRFSSELREYIHLLFLSAIIRRRLVTLGDFSRIFHGKKSGNKTHLFQFELYGANTSPPEISDNFRVFVHPKNHWVIVKLIGVFVSFRDFFVKILPAKHFEPPKIVGSLSMFSQP